MLTGKIYRRVSVAALAIGTWGIQGAFAQGSSQASAVEQVQPPAVEEDRRDRVVVTGSNIAGAAESTALPVEVYTQEDNYKTGNQSTLEFIKGRVPMSGVRAGTRLGPRRQAGPVMLQAEPAG